MDWINAMREAVAYIEVNLFEEIDSDTVARHVNFSSFHFQRIFGAVVGITIAEYIRNRRLTLAGGEMSLSEGRVIDVALKYGYESPESFARAFQRFHGMPPSAARENVDKLRTFHPMSISVNIKGGFNVSNKNPTVLEKLIFKPFGPYRFVGKGVCAAPGSGEVFGALWKDWAKISEPLKNMNEYMLEEEPHNIALLDNKGIEEFDTKMWYTIGFFMKPNTPVPNGYDFRDIPALYVAEGYMKGEFGDMVFSQHRLLQDAICAQNDYVFSSQYSTFAAEVYLPETDADKNGISKMKYYISCELNPDK